MGARRGVARVRVQALGEGWPGCGSRCRGPCQDGVFPVVSRSPQAGERQQALRPAEPWGLV